MEKEHPGLFKEFVEDVQKFTTYMIGRIEGFIEEQAEAPSKAEESQPGEDLKAEQAAIEQTFKRPQKQKAQPVNSIDPAADPLRFAQKYRHLAGKRVTVVGESGNSIQGEVQGATAPFLQVAVKDGQGKIQVLKVPPEKIQA